MKEIAVAAFRLIGSEIQLPYGGIKMLAGDACLAAEPTDI